MVVVVAGVVDMVEEGGKAACSSATAALVLTAQMPT
jgi:hypothetical protein